MRKLGLFFFCLALLVSARISHAQSCLGDCDGNSEVTVDEIILGVNIALELASLGTCPSFDRNQNQEVEIDELITAVNHALESCPPEPTATETAIAPSATPTSPPASATPTEEPATATPTQVAPTPTEAPEPSATATEAITATATVDIDATATATPGDATPTATPDDASPSPTPGDATPTATPDATAIETATPGETATPAETTTPDATPTASPTAIESPDVSPTITGLPEPSATPTESDATPTASPSEPTPTPTAAELPPAEFAAGRTSLVSSSMTAFNGVISSLLVAIKNGSSGSLQRSASAALDIDACPISGVTSEDCFRSDSIANLTLTASQCSAAGPAGGVATFDGTVTLVGPGVCPIPFGGNYNAQLTVQIVPETAPALNIVADVNGNLTPTIDFFSDCLIEALEGTINGTLSATLGSGLGSTITFENTQFTFSNPQYNESCVPVAYTFTFNGAATIGEASSGTSFGVVFDNFAVTHNAVEDPVRVELNGGMQSSCIGNLLFVNTLTPIAVAGGELCPQDGQLQVDSGSLAQVFYRSDGSVDVDSDNDGVVDASYGSCLAAELLSCPQG